MFMMSANHVFPGTANITAIFKESLNVKLFDNVLMETSNTSDQSSTQSANLNSAPAPMSVEQYVAYVRQLINNVNTSPFILAKKLDRLDRMLRAEGMLEHQILSIEDTADKIVSKLEGYGLQTSDILQALENDFLDLEELLRRRGLRRKAPEPSLAIAA